MRILIAEDDPDSQKLIARILQKQGYDVVITNDGYEAWEAFQKEDIHLVITDWMMPRMKGVALCEKIRAHRRPGYVYVILVTSKDEKADLVQALDAGADDYITKPYDKGELLARVRVGERIISLERTISEKNTELSVEKEKSEQLLLSILPQPIAERLKQGRGPIADSYAEASVLLADIHDFSNLVAQKTPDQVVALLGQVFSIFDRLVDQHGLEKIKTLGDKYFVAAGVPTPRPDHAESLAELAFAMQAEIVQVDAGTGAPLQIRIGINSGPVVAGVIGTTKPAYDIWGETVSTAAQMEAFGVAGAIQITAETYRQLGGNYMVEERGEFYVQGRGTIRTFMLLGRSNAR